MDTIFTLQNEDLSRLNPGEAVAFFHQLLCAEAHAVGLPIHPINIPSNVDARDGGIDAEVRDVPAEKQGQGVFLEKLNAYQIKTGDYKLNATGIKDILFNSQGNLKPKIKSCLDQNGRLVIVLFGSDDPEREEGANLKAFRDVLVNIDKKYANARIEVFRQNNLKSFAQRFPTLTLQLRNPSGLGCQTRHSWANNDDMLPPFVMPAGFSERAEQIHALLRSEGQAEHVRILGEPGVGKTRFAFEATKPDDIAPLVAYARASEFLDGPLIDLLLHEHNSFRVIVVLDECSRAQQIYLWNKLKHRGARVKLITINNEPETLETDLRYFDPPVLSAEEIKQIILSYGVPQEHVDRWASYAGRSPRFAHMIGKNLASFPADVLREREGTYDRSLAAMDDPHSQTVKERKTVLTHVALFKRFGMQKPYEQEGKEIAGLVKEADPHITQAKFNEIIKFFIEQHILQGERTLYITPKVLHIYMWVQWWGVNEASFSMDAFIKKLEGTPRLVEWFFEMFRYAAESEAAMNTVKRLLGPGSPFENDKLLKTELGSRFFLSLTEADPKTALRCLQQTIGRQTKEELLSFSTGRRNVLWALERIAVWKEFCTDAARLLLALGEAENETYANNASGMFSDLFSPARGPVAPTEASPEERFPVLQEALSSGSREQRLLGIKACDAALESQHFTRTVGAEYQGLRQEPKLWMPKTSDEVFDAYRRVWNLLSEKLDDLPPEEQQKGVEVLLNRSWGLITMEALAPMVFETLTTLREKAYVDKGTLLKTILGIFRHPELAPHGKAKDELCALQAQLTGNDFPSLMRRYVSMDLLEDRFDARGEQVTTASDQIRKLAEQVIQNQSLLTSELGWLVTEQARNGYEFGYTLGNLDTNFTLLPLLLEAQRGAAEKPSGFFLGGYLRALFDKDRVRWEAQMDALAADEKLMSLVPELTWRSGMSNQAALRVLKMAKKGIINATQLQIFRFGGTTKDVSESVFTQWIEYLLGIPERAAITLALDLSNFYFLRQGHALPKDLMFRLLTHPLLFQKRESPVDTMEEFYWAKLADAFNKDYPENSLGIAEVMLEHFGTEGAITDSYRSQSHTILDAITKNNPIEVWKIIAKYLNPPLDRRAFQITSWLQGGLLDKNDGALPLIPVQEIWAWVDQDVEKRSWYLASFVPKTLTRESGKVCLAREVLIKYGSREDVRRNLMANFSSEVLMGPASQHYREKKQSLLKFWEGEQDENVKRWIDEYVDSLDRQIEHARGSEEREEF